MVILRYCINCRYYLASDDIAGELNVTVEWLIFFILISMAVVFISARYSY
jgi:hypothetical protein